MCRESAGITANMQVLQKMCIRSAGITEDLQVLLKICRKSADITANVQKICRVLRKICRYYRRSAGHCRKSANVTQYWKSYYAKNKVQIKQRLCDQKQRKVRQNIVRIGAWDQESDKLETSLVPSDTLCETPTIKTLSCNHVSLRFSCCLLFNKRHELCIRLLVYYVT